MAIFAAFNIASMGKQQYEQVINTLDIQEKGLVDGCLHHVVSFTSDGLLVGDVWESAEKLASFIEILRPRLAIEGFSLPQPRVYTIDNIITRGG